MKKILFLICMSVLLTHSLYSQEQTIGIQLGVVSENLFETQSLNNYSNLCFGIKYEYTPKIAFFSVSVAIQNVRNAFLTPISINLKVGKKLKFIASGGVMPVFKFWNLDIQKVVELGATCHLGLDYRISKAFSINGSFGIHFIPWRNEIPSHFGGSSIYKVINKTPFILVGVNYLIPSKEK